MKCALYLAAFGWIAAAQESGPELHARQLLQAGINDIKRQVNLPAIGALRDVLANDFRKLSRRLGLKDAVANGQVGRVRGNDPGKIFHSGDRFKLKLTSNSAGYLYVVMRGPKDNWEVLYPMAAASEEHRQLAAGEPIVIPSDDNFKFDKDPGAEHLFIVLSHNPERGFERLIQSVKQRGSGEIAKEQIAELRQKMGQRGIVRERAAEGNPDRCAYAANTKPDPSSRVIAGIDLKHE